MLVAAAGGGDGGCSARQHLAATAPAITRGGGGGGGSSARRSPARALRIPTPLRPATAPPANANGSNNANGDGSTPGGAERLAEEQHRSSVLESLESRQRGIDEEAHEDQDEERREDDFMHHFLQVGAGV